MDQLDLGPRLLHDDDRKGTVTTAPPRQTRDCHICGRENTPPHRWPKTSTYSTCSHQNHACKDCWLDWLQVQTRYCSPDRIPCIACSGTLTEQDIKAFASVQVYAQYLDLAAKNTLSSTPDFHWCLNPRCSSGQIHYGSHGFECGVCKHRHCTVCKLPWTIVHRRHCEQCGAPEHEGRSCEEGATVHSKEEEATMEAMKELAKQCPGCHRRIEKVADGGCDWISCTKCLHEFCWVCLASHKEIKSKENEAHAEDCVYYSIGQPLAFPFSNH